MREPEIANEDKLLAAGAYAFFIPSLYIILTEKRKNKFLAFAAAQSLLLWVAYTITVIILRVLLNLIWMFSYVPFIDHLVMLLKIGMWGYALFLAGKAIYGKTVRIPYLSGPADQIC